MNSADTARRAYGPVGSPTRTARDAEKHVLVQATAALRSASIRPDQFPRLAEAIQVNRMLWTRLAGDVAEPTNPLPADLRARIFYLAQFTDHHSRRVLNGDATVEALIEVNTAVIRGLGTPAMPVRGAA